MSHNTSGDYPVAIIGSGNIGTDLMIKIMRTSDILEMGAMVGIDPSSDGLARAQRLGVATTHEGIEGLQKLDVWPEIGVVFDATSAGAHKKHSDVVTGAGKVMIDLTPAAIGPYVIPVVNGDDHLDASNVNMVTCGGQATIPMVAAVSSVADVHYAEIVASISSKSAGPGTRANIDEFTETTAHGLEAIGGAARGKAIIILNPAEPPMIMRDTVFCSIPAECDRDAVAASIHDMVSRVQEYVPGFTLRAEPQFDDPRDIWNGLARVAVFLEVLGNGDFLPRYAGNLDIITAASARVGDLMAQAKVGASA